METGNILGCAYVNALTRLVGIDLHPFGPLLHPGFRGQRPPAGLDDPGRDRRQPVALRHRLPPQRAASSTGASFSFPRRDCKSPCSGRSTRPRRTRGSSPAITRFGPPRHDHHDNEHIRPRKRWSAWDRSPPAEPPQQMKAVVGSCIALALYHPGRKTGVMAHIVLPDSAGRDGTPGKFADTAVPQMLELLKELGMPAHGLTAKLAGGANMFGSSGPLQIGDANVEAVAQALRTAGIRVSGARHRRKARTPRRLRLRRRRNDRRIRRPTDENSSESHQPAHEHATLFSTRRLEPCHADYSSPMTP